VLERSGALGGVRTPSAISPTTPGPLLEKRARCSHVCLQPTTATVGSADTAGPVNLGQLTSRRAGEGFTGPLRLRGPFSPPRTLGSQVQLTFLAPFVDVAQILFTAKGFSPHPHGGVRHPDPGRVNAHCLPSFPFRGVKSGLPAVLLKLRAQWLQHLSTCGARRRPGLPDTGRSGRLRARGGQRGPRPGRTWPPAPNL